MKKAIAIILAAAVAAFAGTAAACSKGQTGGGNNTMGEYARTVEEENAEGENGQENPCPDCDGEDKPCPDCRDKEGHGGRRFMHPKDGGAWAGRRKPAPVPPPPAQSGEDGEEETPTADRRPRDEGGERHKKPVPKAKGAPEKTSE